MPRRYVSLHLDRVRAEWHDENQREAYRRLATEAVAELDRLRRVNAVLRVVAADRRDDGPR